MDDGCTTHKHLKPQQGGISIYSRSAILRANDLLKPTLTVCPNPGYFSIHLLGLSTGTILFPSSPSYFRRYSQMRKSELSGAECDSSLSSISVIGSSNQYSVKAKEWNHNKRQDDKTAIELCSYLVVWLVLFSLAHLCGLGVNVSRQLVHTHRTR